MTRTAESNTPLKTVTGLSPAEEKEAAIQVLKLLRTLRSEIALQLESGHDVHWISDLKELCAGACRFLFQTLARGEVKITLFGGEAVAEETEIPGIWKMWLGEQTSLVAGRLPRSVAAAIEKGDTDIHEPEKKPEGLFAAPALIAELRETLKSADLSVIPETAVRQIDLLHQPLSPTDINYVLTTLGTGKTAVDISGFARTRIDSTKVKGLWRTRILNNAGKPLMDALTVALIPPEVPSGSDDWPESLKKLDEMIEWIDNDLKRGVLGA